MTDEEIKILLVDDDEDIAPLVQTKLQKHIKHGRTLFHDYFPYESIMTGSYIKKV